MYYQRNLRQGFVVAVTLSAASCSVPNAVDLALEQGRAVVAVYRGARDVLHSVSEQYKPRIHYAK
jgi:hypothetical protein